MEIATHYGAIVRRQVTYFSGKKCIRHEFVGCLHCCQLETV